MFFRCPFWPPASSLQRELPFFENWLESDGRSFLRAPFFRLLSRETEGRRTILRVPYVKTQDGPTPEKSTMRIDGGCCQKDVHVSVSLSLCKPCRWLGNTPFTKRVCLLVISMFKQKDSYNFGGSPKTKIVWISFVLRSVRSTQDATVATPKPHLQGHNEVSLSTMLTFC